MIRSFIEAEFFKLRHSRTVKITLLTMILTPIIAIGLLWQFKTPYTRYPGVLALIGGTLLLLVGLTSLLLVAASLGNEYEQETVRMIISRGTPRWLFVAGKGISLLGISLLNILALWLSGLIVASLAHISQVGSSGLQMGIAAMFTSGLDVVAIITLAATAYIGLGLSIGVLTRSTSFTMFAGISLVLADFYFYSVKESPLVFSILGNVNVLLNQLYFQMVPGDIFVRNSGSPLLVTEPKTAVLILLSYALGGTAFAILLFQRQELED